MNARTHKVKLWCGKKPTNEVGIREGVLVFQVWAPAIGLFKKETGREQVISAHNIIVIQA